MSNINKTPKERSRLVLGSIIVIILIIIAIGVIIIATNKKESTMFDNYDETIGEENSAISCIAKSEIANIDSFLFQKNERVNIIVTDTNTEYDYEKLPPYMENVKIINVRDEDICVSIPNEYLNILTIAQFSSAMTIKIEKPTDKNGAFKINKELNNLFAENYQSLEATN